MIELLDGAVAAAYVDAGLAYRPRYTPVMRALMQQEWATIGFIADAAGISQPAATQTIGLMIKDGLVCVEASATDGRQKLISLTQQGRELVSPLTVCWQATAAAAASLEAELPCPLAAILDSAIDALSAKSYGARIREARADLDVAPAPPVRPAK
ncbi:MAG: MarR family transcriptional regulator [Pseudomonadota bacterium]|nr:MarR family transcriptional regulator [Pseudomonadota bacterium]